MSFSFCLNRTDVLIVCGMTLLYQTLDLKHESKIVKDAERLVNSVLKGLVKTKAPGSYDLKRVAFMLISVDEPMSPSTVRSSPESSAAAPLSKASPPAPISKKPFYVLGRHPSASMSETDLLSQQEKLRRMTMPHSAAVRPELYRSQSRASFDEATQRPVIKRQDQHRSSISQIQQSMMRLSPTQKNKPNLDYLSLSNTPATPQPPSPNQSRVPTQAPTTQPRQQTRSPLYSMNQLPPKPASGTGMTTSEWESLLGALDGGQINLYDAIYGGPAVSLETPTAVSPDYTDWPPNSWNLTGFNLGDPNSNPAAPQSVFSLSDDSLSSGEELGPSDVYFNMNEDFRNSMMHANRQTTDGSLVSDGLDLNLGI
jgi:hypothetical protein